VLPRHRCTRPAALPCRLPAPSGGAGNPGKQQRLGSGCWLDRSVGRSPARLANRIGWVRGYAEFRTTPISVIPATHELSHDLIRKLHQIGDCSRSGDEPSRSRNVISLAGRRRYVPGDRAEGSRIAGPTDALVWPLGADRGDACSPAPQVHRPRFQGPVALHQVQVLVVGRGGSTWVGGPRTRSPTGASDSFVGRGEGVLSLGSGHGAGCPPSRVQPPSGRVRPLEHGRQRDASQTPMVFCRFLVRYRCCPVGLSTWLLASAATGCNEVHIPHGDASRSRLPKQGEFACSRVSEGLRR
jgi:hypothetical protein